MSTCCFTQNVFEAAEERHNFRTRPLCLFNRSSSQPQMSLIICKVVFEHVISRRERDERPIGGGKKACYMRERGKKWRLGREQVKAIRADDTVWHSISTDMAAQSHKCCASVILTLFWQDFVKSWQSLDFVSKDFMKALIFGCILWLYPFMWYSGIILT